MNYNENEETGTELICVNCKNTFLFSDGEREFYESKGYTEPRRCKPCRLLKKKQNEANTGKTETRVIS